MACKSLYRYAGQKQQFDKKSFQKAGITLIMYTYFNIFTAFLALRVRLDLQVYNLPRRAPSQTRRRFESNILRVSPVKTKSKTGSGEVILRVMKYFVELNIMHPLNILYIRLNIKNGQLEASLTGSKPTYQSYFSQ